MSTSRAPRNRGFTLVEILIALSLLSLLMLILTGAMRSMGQTEERVEARAAASEDYRTAVYFLQEIIGRVSARRLPTVAVEGAAQMPFFEAQPNSLAWIGVMPARFGLGGRHYLRLAVESAAGGANLVLRYAPWDGAPTFDAWGGAPGQVLVSAVQGLSLRYQDPGTGAWSPVWPPAGMAPNQLPPARLPGAVELSIVGPEPAWPPLVIGVTPTLASDSLRSAITFGGGAIRK